MRVLRRVHLSILDEIVSSDFGISFNVLAKRIRGKVSRVTLSREIRKLVSLGLIDITPDPSHKQRLFYRAKDEVRKLAKEFRRFRVSRASDIDQLLENVSSLLRFYAMNIKDIKNKALRDYLKHLVLDSLEDTLTIMEEWSYGQGSVDRR